MKKTNLILALMLLLIAAVNTLAQGTAFTYQGRLDVTGVPATGTYDFQFILYDAATGGNEQGPIRTNTATAVSNGLFTVTLDFGNEFPGAARWLDISVRTNGGAGFAELTPRQEFTAAPYSITAGALAAGAYTSAVTFNNAADSFTGAGGGLTGLNASSLSSGTVADVRLSTNVALRAGGNTFSGNQTVTAGSIYLDNSQEIYGKNTLGSYEGFLWPRWSDNVSYLNFGSGGFNIRNDSSISAMFMQNNGNVGIGTMTPGFPLSFANTLGDKIALWGTSGDNFGLGIQGSQLQIHANVSSSDIVFGYGQSSSLTELMRIKGTGNVGIGTASPQKALQVGDSGVPGSQGMIHLASRAPTSGAARDWDIGVPQTGDNATGIGYSFIVHDSAMSYPAQLLVAFNSGYVGIGTTNPAATLDVNGSANVASTLTAAGGINATGTLNLNTGGYPGVTAFIRAQPGDNLPLAVQGTNGVNLLLIDTNGNASVSGSLSVANGLSAGNGNSIFGFNTTYGNVTMNVRQDPALSSEVFRVENSSGGALFDVFANGGINAGNGSSRFNFNTGGYNNVTMTVNAISGDLYGLDVLGTPADTASIFWTVPSDERLKYNIQPCDYGLTELMQLHTISYRYRDDPARGLNSKHEHTGVLAQEVQKVFPDAVLTQPDGYLALTPDPIFWASINAIQELNQKLESKDQEVAELKSQLAELKQMVNSLSEKVNGAGK
ncbi:MAG TPA: tail fiber domain-containing protein [Verrucomicrobiae bacterium]|nr:tail fiber domain-containing protein [Verrucomicrobiae bacterium]